MANITTQTIRVDLSTGKVIPTAYTHQMDTARTLVFDMYNGGLPYTMTGNTVKFAYKSPIVNGQYTVIAGSSMASGTVSGNKVTVALPVAYTRISGVGLLTMIITPSSGTIRPVNIRLVVQKSADGANEIAGSSDFPTTLESFVNQWIDANAEDQVEDWLNGNAADRVHDWVDDALSGAELQPMINTWLDEHPEATTTVQDGSLTYPKFAKNTLLWVTPEMFGGVGDGVSDDTVAVQTAINNGNVILRGRYLVTSNLNLNSNKLLGYDSTIVLSNCQIIYSDSCDIEGVSFISVGNVSTCIRFDSSTYCESVNIVNCFFNNANSSDITRQNVGIRARSKNINIEHIEFTGYVAGIVYEPYLNVKNGLININDIVGYNIQYLLDFEGSISNIIEAPVVRNISLINNVTQKNSITTEVGSDAVLMNYCKNIIVENVIAINPRERAVYANHVRDGLISDVYCYGSQVVKVCGTAEYYAERITVNNVSGEEIGDNGYLFTTYYSRNIAVRNIDEYTSSDLNNAQMIRLQNDCHDITIDGFVLNGATRGAIALEKSDANTSLTNITIKNGVIKNCNMRAQNYAILLSDTSHQGITWIDGLIVENVALNPDKELVGYTNGFINLENIANVLLKDNLIRGVVANSLLTLGIIKGSNVRNLKLVGIFPVATRDSYSAITFASDSNVRTQNHGGTNNFDGILTSDGTTNNAIVEGTITLTSSLTQILDSDSASYPYIEINGNGHYGKWMLINNVVTAIGTVSGITVDKYGRMSAETDGKYYIKFIR